MTVIRRYWKENGTVWFCEATKTALVRPATDTGYRQYPVAFFAWEKVKNQYHGQALVTAVIVSTCGAIGFVGLVLPHAARALVGGRHRVLVPTSALMGVIFLVWIDAASRTVIAPQELPVGVATALIGVPAFVVLLLRRGRGR